MKKIDKKCCLTCSDYIDLHGVDAERYPFGFFHCSMKGKVFRRNHVCQFFKTSLLCSV